MNRPTTATSSSARRPAWLTRNVKVLCGVSFLQDAASELLYPILPIFLTTVLGAPPAVVGAIEGLAEGAASVTKVAAGRLSDRFARRPLISAGYGLAAVGKLLIALATVWPLVLVARVVDRLGKGMRGAPRDALLVDGVPNGQRGKVFGLHRAADTAGAVVGPLAGLALYEALDHRLRPLFWVAVIPAVASVALVAAVRDPGRKGSASTTTARTPWRSLPRPYWRVLAVLLVFNLVNFPDALLLLRAHDLGLSTAASSARTWSTTSPTPPCPTPLEPSPTGCRARSCSWPVCSSSPSATSALASFTLRGWSLWSCPCTGIRRLHRRCRQGLDLHPRPRSPTGHSPGPLPGRHRRRCARRRPVGRTRLGRRRARPASGVRRRRTRPGGRVARPGPLPAGHPMTAPTSVRLPRRPASRRHGDRTCLLPAGTIYGCFATATATPHATALQASHTAPDRPVILGC
ncbi:MFS transporter [Streptomyces chiangmaiensis]